VTCVMAGTTRKANELARRLEAMERKGDGKSDEESEMVVVVTIPINLLNSWELR